MKNIFLFLILGITNLIHGASYPENVFAFDLSPSTIEYFKSESGNKIKIFSNLDINDLGFYLNTELLITYNKVPYQYFLRFLIEEDGNIYLESLRDNLYIKKFTRKFVIPSDSKLQIPFQSQIGKNISISYIPESNDKNQIKLLLNFGFEKIIITLKKMKGILEIRSKDDIYRMTTLRIYNQ